MERKTKMTERRKLELQLNVPTEIELLYDEPVIGKSQYGDYFLYAVKSLDTEFAFFAPEEIHSELQNLRRGARAIVTKSAEQRGNKLVTRYLFELPNEDELSDIGKQTLQIPSEPAKQDTFYEIMLSSYKDALQIQSELNGMVDVSRIAITLFIARSGKK